jgi:hypothetical protein
MKITTTFWSDEVHEFNKLLYINGKTKEVVFQTDLNDIFTTFLFFKDISNFVKSDTVRKTIDASSWERDVYYQFATINETELCPIKWFNVVINDKVSISHDIAFETTLIKKNGIDIPLGIFPHWAYGRNPHVKLPKHREFNMKARAYNFIANQIKKSFAK